MGCLRPVAHTVCVPVRTLRVVLTVMLPSTRLSSQPTPTSLSERVTAGHTSRRYFSAGQTSGQVSGQVCWKALESGQLPWPAPTPTQRQTRHAMVLPESCWQLCRMLHAAAAMLLSHSPLYLGKRVAKELSSSRPVGLSSLVNCSIFQ